jgi:hypothetical protein
LTFLDELKLRIVAAIETVNTANTEEQLEEIGYSFDILRATKVARMFNLFSILQHWFYKNKTL